ncbi:unnamed protein product [Closterium sp. NIES-54]
MARGGAQHTPCFVGHHLSPPTSPSTSSHPYLELVDSLMYAMVSTRPDLAYPISILTRFVGAGNHTEEHWQAAKRVFRYLHSTKDYVLTLGGPSPRLLSGYSDSSWADSRPDRRSSQGYGFSLSSGLISWRSTRSSAIALSSYKAELYATTMAAQEARWLIFLLEELGSPQHCPTICPLLSTARPWEVSEAAAEAVVAAGANVVGAAEGVLRVAASGSDVRLFVKVGALGCHRDVIWPQQEAHACMCACGPSSFIPARCCSSSTSQQLSAASPPSPPSSSPVSPFPLSSAYCSSDSTSPLIILPVFCVPIPSPSLLPPPPPHNRIPIYSYLLPIFLASLAESFPLISLQRGNFGDPARYPYVRRIGQPRATSWQPGTDHTEPRCFFRLDDLYRAEHGGQLKTPDWLALLKKDINDFACDWDVIHAGMCAMYATSASVEDDFYLCVPRVAGPEAASLGSWFAPYYPACRAVLQPARHALLQPARRALLQPARRALLPCPSCPAAARASRPAALRVAPCCSPRVMPCCPAQRAPCCPHRPGRAAPTRPSRAAQPKPPSCYYYCFCWWRYCWECWRCRHPAPPSRPAATTTAAGGGAAGSAGGAAGAGGTGGATGSTGGVAGARGAGPTTNHHCLSWPQSRQLQQLGVDSSGHHLSRTTPPLSSFQCVPGRVEAAALGSSESAAAPGAGESAAALGAHESANALGASASTTTGPASAEALHTFTLDSSASRCFFRDCTTLTPLATPVPVSLADPTGGLVVVRASTFLPCPAVPFGSLSGLHLPAFSTNLLSNAVLQDEWVDTLIPRGQHVANCKCSRTGSHLDTFTRQPGSGLYTLTTTSAQVAESAQVAASSRVSASGQLAASCSCRVLSHQTLSSGTTA